MRMHSSLLISINPVAQEKQLWLQITHVGVFGISLKYLSVQLILDYISAVHTSCYMFIILVFIRLLPSCVNEIEKLILAHHLSVRSHQLFPLWTCWWLLTQRVENNMKFYPLKHVSHFGYIIKCLSPSHQCCYSLWLYMDAVSKCTQPSTVPNIINTVDNKLFALEIYCLNTGFLNWSWWGEQSAVGG